MRVLLSGGMVKLAAAGTALFVGGGTVGGVTAAASVEPKVETVTEYVEVEAEPEVVTETVVETETVSDPADAERIAKLEAQVEACVEVIASNFEVIALGAEQSNILGRYVDITADAIDEAMYEGVPSSTTIQALGDLHTEQAALTDALAANNPSDDLGADLCGDKDW